MGQDGWKITDMAMFGEVVTIIFSGNRKFSIKRIGTGPDHFMDISVTRWDRKDKWKGD